MGWVALLVPLVAGVTTVVAAQPAAESTEKGATDVRVPVAPLTYQSPFARYRPMTDGAVGEWKAVNDEVARIGGWRAYAREVYEASLQAAPVEPPMQSPASAPERRLDGADKPR